MSRPGLVTLLSAVVASIAAFLVLKGWGLIGTLTGAALFPVVHTLASHFSSRGIDQTVAVLRKRTGDEEAPAGAGEPAARGPIAADPVTAEPVVAGPDTADRPTRRPPLPNWTRWLPVGLACVALGVGVYSVFLGPPAERVIVRERIIEREQVSAAQLTTVSDKAATVRSGTEPETSTATSTTTSVADENVPATDSSSTTLAGSTVTVDPGGSAEVAPSDSPDGENTSTSSTDGVGSSVQTTVPPTQKAP